MSAPPGRVIRSLNRHTFRGHWLALRPPGVPAGVPAVEQLGADRERDRGVEPPHDDVDHEVLSGVDEGEGHAEGVGEEEHALRLRAPFQKNRQINMG